MLVEVGRRLQGEAEKRWARAPLTRIAAAIYCERDGQKAILIGKGGAKLKEIGTGARRKIESLLGTRVYLELHVIVEPNWRESKSFVESLDWRNQLERLGVDQITETDSGEEKLGGRWLTEGSVPASEVQIQPIDLATDSPHLL